MYRIVKINEDEISEFKGHIVQVISREQTEVINSVKGYYEMHPGTHFEWVLVCLVEEHEPTNPEL